jgi:predicted Zn-dependent protease
MIWGKVYKELFLIILIFFIGWAFFTFLKLEPVVPNLEVSIEDEERLGEVLNELLFQDVNEIHTPSLDSAIFIISNRLENGLDLTSYDFTFHVIRSDEVNAFATLGGHIFIHSALIEVTETPEELAAVLAHEMGHVEHRHVVDKMVTEIGVTILFSVFTGNDPALISELVELSLSNVFSRGQENEADQFGLNLLVNSEISPFHMAHVFRKFKSESSGDFTPEILSTHPNINSRIRKAMTYETEKRFIAKPINLDWDKVKRNLKASL